MTAPGRLAAAIASMAMLAGAAGCDAPLAPDREDEPDVRSSASAAPSPSTGPSPSVEQTGRADAEAQARRAHRQAARRAAGSVVAISVDGLNPAALTQLGPSRLPQLHSLIRTGASTLNARTALEMTETLPNHTGMLTGRPVEGASGHRVDFNTDPGDVTVSSHAGRTIVSVFDAVHASGRTSSLYASKSKFEVYERSWGGSIDRTVIEEDNAELVEALVSELTTRPADFTFVHLSAPDIAGHDSGFMGAAYFRAVEQVDRLLGQIRAAVAASPLRGRAHLIVTADHGGRGTSGHAAADKPDDYRIPFIVSGPAVRPGSDLYALNRDYRDPGSGRPSYDGAQPVRNGDLADLATRLLGLPPVPGSVFGVHDVLDVR